MIQVCLPRHCSCFQDFASTNTFHHYNDDKGDNGDDNKGDNGDDNDDDNDINDDINDNDLIGNVNVKGHVNVNDECGFDNESKSAQVQIQVRIRNVFVYVHRERAMWNIFQPLFGDAFHNDNDNDNDNDTGSDNKKDSDCTSTRRSLAYSSLSTENTNFHKDDESTHVQATAAIALQIMLSTFGLNHELLRLENEDEHEHEHEHEHDYSSVEAEVDVRPIMDQKPNSNNTNWSITTFCAHKTTSTKTRTRNKKRTRTNVNTAYTRTRTNNNNHIPNQTKNYCIRIIFIPPTTNLHALAVPYQYRSCCTTSNTNHTSCHDNINSNSSFNIYNYSCNYSLRPERIFTSALVKLENLQIKLQSLNAYIATLGGGYFLCHYLSTAICLARYQRFIALQLNDVPLALKCTINEAYNYIHAGRKQMAFLLIRGIESHIQNIRKDQYTQSNDVDMKRFEKENDRDIGILEDADEEDVEVKKHEYDEEEDDEYDDEYTVIMGMCKAAKWFALRMKNGTSIKTVHHHKRSSTTIDDFQRIRIVKDKKLFL